MNEACCTRPVISADYTPVGKKEKLEDGMEVYITGPASATRGIIYIYDAFGFTQHQFMGADLLAASLSARVFMPDFFRGEGVSTSVFGLGPEERGAAFTKFMTGPGDMGKARAAAEGMPAELGRSHASGVEKWAAVGFCWGGKVVAMTSGEGTRFDVSGACHPGRLDPEEARGFAIPHVCLLSGEDGTEEEKKAYEKALGENGRDVKFEVFWDQVHGWMAARADLADEKVRKEFERGYDEVAKFFEKHM